MGLFSKKQKVKIKQVDPTLPDDRWISACESNFNASVSPYYGSPETMAQGAWDALGVDDPGTALFFNRKSIDILHTHYIASSSVQRTPGPNDSPIVIGFISTLSIVKESHPGADLTETVQEVTHRLRSISSLCQRSGLPADQYLSVLDEIARLAPEVDVSTVLWT